MIGLWMLDLNAILVSNTLPRWPFIISAGVFDSAGDTGQMAQRISNASFATLSLIYSLTEMLDLAELLATVAGLTARVSKLIEVNYPSDLFPSSIRLMSMSAKEEWNQDFLGPWQMQGLAWINTCTPKLSLIGKPWKRRGWCPAFYLQDDNQYQSQQKLLELDAIQTK